MIHRLCIILQTLSWSIFIHIWILTSLFSFCVENIQKMPWSHYLVRSVDKATVGEANQLMIRAGFRDASNYRSLMLKLKNAYANIVSDPKITLKKGTFG